MPAKIRSIPTGTSTPAPAPAPRPSRARRAGHAPGSTCHTPAPAPSPAALLAELDRVRAELDALEAQLQHQERLATLGTIAGLIAHEFNNILTPIMSYSQMALGSPQDHDLAAKALGKCLSGSERAAKIASAILEFVRDDGPTLRTPSRADGDSGPPRPAAPVASIRSAIDETLACLARHPSRDGIALHVEAAPDLGAAIRPVALQHILLNLVLNARNAMIPGGGSLSITAQTQPVAPAAAPGTLDSRACSTWNIPASPAADQAPAPPPIPGPWAVIEIEDSGRGMSPDRLADLFRPFSTDGHDRPADGDRRRRGTGLGMTICKRLAEDAGGWIAIQSTPGQGTHATIVLPAA